MIMTRNKTIQNQSSEPKGFCSAKVCYPYEKYHFNSSHISTYCFKSIFISFIVKYKWQKCHELPETVSGWLPQMLAL